MEEKPIPGPSHPDIMAGAPCITGTRITVWVVYYRWEHEREAFMQDYPYLTLRQITAAVEYARAHPDETVQGQGHDYEPLVEGHGSR